MALFDPMLFSNQGSGLFGGLFGSPAQQPTQPYPPVQPVADNGSFATGLSNFAHSKGVLPAISNLVTGLTSGRRTDLPVTGDIANYEYAQTHPGFAAFKSRNQAKFGLTPVYGTGPDGKPVLMQLNSAGGANVVKTPDGVTVSTGVDKIDMGNQWGLMDKRSGQFIGVMPKNIRAAASERAIGQSQGTAAASLPSDILNADQTVRSIDELLKNPGLSSIVGPLDQFRPSWTFGEAGRDALARYEQLKGKAFLQAYTTLKGGGQITEVEGRKAEDALVRLNRSQSEGSFKKALTDFRDAVKQGVEKMKERAGQRAQNNGTPDPLAQAREAISRGADRNAVIQRLQQHGINPAGL